LEEREPASPDESTEAAADPRLTRFVSGESDAVSWVTTISRHVVNDHAYSIPYDERPDIVQEAVLHVYRAVTRPGFRLRQEFEAVVRSITYRRCIDWKRRRRETALLDPEAHHGTVPGPDGSVLDKETLARGRQVLADLGESCRQLIRLRARDELSYRQIAERLGRSEGGLRNQMYKCLRRARAILEQLEHEATPGGREG
jgi:RNA polymerase sigma-70 factor (ECF subfamily)